MSIGFGKCEVCGTTLFLGIGFGNRNNWRTKDGKVCCSERCNHDYNKMLLYKGSKKSKKDKKIKNYVESEINNVKDKEDDAEDKRFIDSIKKVVLFKRNREVKEQHKKLLEIEADIILALSKENTDKAIQLIKRLELDSSLLVPNSDVSYRDFWENKRAEFLKRV